MLRLIHRNKILQLWSQTDVGDRRSEVWLSKNCPSADFPKDSTGAGISENASKQAESVVEHKLGTQEWWVQSLIKNWVGGDEGTQHRRRERQHNQRSMVSNSGEHRKS